MSAIDRGEDDVLGLAGLIVLVALIALIWAGYKVGKSLGIPNGWHTDELFSSIVGAIGRIPAFGETLSKGLASLWPAVEHLPGQSKPGPYNMTTQPSGESATITEAQYPDDGTLETQGDETAYQIEQ